MTCHVNTMQPQATWVIAMQHIINSLKRPKSICTKITISEPFINWLHCWTWTSIASERRASWLVWRAFAHAHRRAGARGVRGRSTTFIAFLSIMAKQVKQQDRVASTELAFSIIRSASSAAALVYAFHILVALSAMSTPNTQGGPTRRRQARQADIWSDVGNQISSLCLDVSSLCIPAARRRRSERGAFDPYSRDHDRSSIFQRRQRRQRQYAAETRDEQEGLLGSDDDSSLNADENEAGPSPIWNIFRGSQPAPRQAPSSRRRVGSGAGVAVSERTTSTSRQARDDAPLLAGGPSDEYDDSDAISMLSDIVTRDARGRTRNVRRARGGRGRWKDVFATPPAFSSVSALACGLFGRTTGETNRSRRIAQRRTLSAQEDEEREEGGETPAEDMDHRTDSLPRSQSAASGEGDAELIGESALDQLARGQQPQAQASGIPTLDDSTEQDAVKVASDEETTEQVLARQAAEEAALAAEEEEAGKRARQEVAETAHKQASEFPVLVEPTLAAASDHGLAEEPTAREVPLDEVKGSRRDAGTDPLSNAGSLSDVAPDPLSKMESSSSSSSPSKSHRRGHRSHKSISGRRRYLTEAEAEAAAGGFDLGYEINEPVPTTQEEGNDVDEFGFTKEDIARAAAAYEREEEGQLASPLVGQTPAEVHHVHHHYFGDERDEEGSLGEVVDEEYGDEEDDDEPLSPAALGLVPAAHHSLSAHSPTIDVGDETGDTTVKDPNADQEDEDGADIAGLGFSKSRRKHSSRSRAAGSGSISAGTGGSGGSWSGSGSGSGTRKTGSSGGLRYGLHYQHEKRKQAAAGGSDSGTQMLSPPLTTKAHSTSSGGKMSYRDKPRRAGGGTSSSKSEGGEVPRYSHTRRGSKSSATSSNAATATLPAQRERASTFEPGVGDF